jgi:hypothetical protein
MLGWSAGATVPPKATPTSVATMRSPSILRY